MEALRKAHEAWARNHLRFHCRGKLVYSAPRGFCPECGRLAENHEYQISLQIGP